MQIMRQSGWIARPLKNVGAIHKLPRPARNGLHGLSTLSQRAIRLQDKVIGWFDSAFLRRCPLSQIVQLFLEQWQWTNKRSCADNSVFRVNRINSAQWQRGANPDRLSFI